MDPVSTQSMVLEVLQRASSQNADILKPAEAKLREWEIQPGFYSMLYNILSNHSIDLNVRWIAVLYLKIGVDRYWRKSAPNAISEDEKRTIRQALGSNYQEPVNQIAIQLAVLVSKVARMDCPRDWPELFPMLLQAVESSDPIVQHRSLLTLHHVVKAISSKRLPGDRRLFQEFTSNIYSFILNLWNNFTECFINSVMQNASVDTINSNLEKALLTLRILRKLTVHGFYKPHLNQNCMSFMKVVFDRARACLMCRKQLSSKAAYLVETCEKLIIHLTKILLSVLDVHPLSFVEFIQPTLDFTFSYIFTSEGTEFIFERLTIQCFNLIKGILLCPQYRPAKILEMTKEQDTLKAYQIKSDFFQPNTLTVMCKKLVSHYFILTQEDLELWDADPETFANDEGGECWKYSLRPSMETVFVTLFHEFRDTLAPVLLEMIRETHVIVSPEDLQGILRKDAVYNAVGLAAFDMYDEVDFDQWFTNTLTQELKIKHNNYRVIRRRVSWLIGSWTGIKLSPELRPALYSCVANLLNPEEDMAVRLTASTALRHAIDDFEFNSDQFKPYLDSLFNLLFTLLHEAQEGETKMHVLNVMTLLVERVGQTVSPHTDGLIHYLPLLWRESEEHNMLRCAIVATLVQLVKALGKVSAELNPFLLPVIQLGTDTTQSAIVYLLEDCLELWLTVLENSTTMTNELVQLFNNMPTLIEYNSENLRWCLLVTLAHVLLSPDVVMETQGRQIVTVCNSILSDMRTEGIVMVVGLMETFIRASPMKGCETVKLILPKIFENIYQTDELPTVLSMYLCVVSRVLLATHEVFTQTLRDLAHRNYDNEENILSKILDVWVKKMPNVSQIEHRKLLGLALTNLLTTQSQSVLRRFRGIMVNILEALNDVMKTDESSINMDSLVLSEGQSPSHFHEDSDSYYDTEHDQRKKQLIVVDPVHTIVLKDYLQSQIYILRNQLGQAHYEQLLQQIDADTVTQLREYIVL
ncbi:PREDICTED: importin-11 [Nicrophorus vespilloides]|uniref:Importin-11 n=1 Tax=Nicrophorus vespilloides TaxID=110193 RepID=A0ABM1MM73_NICVS|nr:PREDICTED: importin-11 [Nicrophorus vespilloides]